MDKDPYKTWNNGTRDCTSDLVAIGLERCLIDPPAVLRGARFGLLMNQASVDRYWQYSHVLLSERFPGQLRVLFGPQHGFWGQQQDNMVETPHGTDPLLNLPIYSLYGKHRKPTPEMLQGLDCLVIDLQSVGTRVYTFIWTLANCLQACAESGVSVVVLDRPNPVGGAVIEGPMLHPEYRSFIGLHPIPMRHGLTLGELARHLNRAMGIGAEVHVVAMHGWSRSMNWDVTGRRWVGPSPNLPRMEGVALYPGQVLLEGTNLSEGRGTTTPFELFGAPFIDPVRLLEALQPFALHGVILRPICFEPTFQKWKERECRGLYLHISDVNALSSYKVTLAILASVHRLWPRQFQWRRPPYEYEDSLMPIDILAGSSELRETINADVSDDAIDALSHVDASAWWGMVDSDLLYR